jgi:glutamate-ammonia-ligase adenylyltransferase
VVHEHRQPRRWDLKNRPGGLIDLEFIVQYLMLREAATHPQVLHRATADALPALAASGLLPPEALRELEPAAELLRHALLLLTLLFDDVPRSGDFPGPEAEPRTLRRCG